jgi:hypothetical protein
VLLDVPPFVQLFWQIFGGLRHVLGRSEPTGSLLVQLGAGCHAVDGHVHGNPWLDDLGDDPVEVVHDSQHHVPFRYDIGNVHVTGMRTSVDDPVHVEIQVIKLRQEGGIGNDFIDLGVPFADPSVKLTRVLLCVLCCAINRIELNAMERKGVAVR